MAAMRRDPVSAAALAAVSVGGALGALARHGLACALPTVPAGFPWATFLTNVSGCLLIGVLLALVADQRRAAHPLLRPFLGVGVLGGYTTFSTYTLEIQRLVSSGAAGTALLYLAGTLAAVLTAVYAGAAVVRAAHGPAAAHRPAAVHRPTGPGSTPGGTGPSTPSGPP